MENQNTETQEQSNETKRPFSLKEKIKDLSESLIIGLSIVLTFVVFFRFGQYIPKLNWPYNLDSIFIFILIMFLIYSFLYSVKYLVMILLGLGTLYLLFALTVHIIRDWNELKSSNNPSPHFFLIQDLYHLKPQLDNTTQKLDSTRIEIQRLQT